MEAITPRVIVGLGNPGSEYEQTRHNAGFMVIDRLRADLPGAADAPKHTADSFVWSVRVGGQQRWLQTPLTFMNNSGAAVAKFSRAHGVAPAEILVVSDEVELPFGRLRLRIGGGSGGHRGLESLVACLGSSDFQRLRIGVGPQPDGVTRHDYVLEAFTDAERDGLGPVLTTAAEALKLTLHRGIVAGMNQFNGWEPTGEEDTETTQQEMLD